MVTTKVAAQPDPWGAPWVTPAVRARYANVGRNLREQVAVASDQTDDVDDDEPTVIQRRDPTAAENAIREATGTTVDASVRLRASVEGDSTPLDASSVSEAMQADLEPIDDFLPAIRAEEALATEQAAAERRAKRNARDRSRRLRVFKAKVRRGVVHHGPVPKGA